MNASDYLRLLVHWGRPLGNALRDLAPIVVVIGLFQALVFRQPLDDAWQVMTGLVLVVAGLALFVSGLEMGLFPLGEQMAHDFAARGSVPWLVAFAFSLGFGTTFAEPALIAVSRQAADLHAAAAPPHEQDAMRASYAWALRLTVAVAVGGALVVGVLRIVLGWRTHYLMLAGYAVLIALTPLAPQSAVGVAYDIGAVTMSTITVPLTAALGIGLASSVQGRSALADGFGVIALAALTPSLLVLLLEILWS